MPAPILPVSSTIASLAPASAAAIAGSGKDFLGVFSEAVQKVEAFQKNAQQSIDRFLSGEGEEIHKVALATQQAQLSFDLFLQVRNKVVTAYQEVMRMQM